MASTSASRECARPWCGTTASSCRARAAPTAGRGWPIGIVDATPVRHLRPVAGAYPRDEAIAEAEAFLDGRAYVTREQAGETLAEHRAL